MITPRGEAPPEILLVLEEPGNFGYLFDELDKRQWGFGLACEYDGAWGLLDHHGYSAAIVQLPDKGGIDLYDELRSNGFLVPFVLLSEEMPVSQTDFAFRCVDWPYYKRNILAALKSLGVIRSFRRRSSRAARFPVWQSRRLQRIIRLRSRE